MTFVVAVLGCSCGSDAVPSSPTPGTSTSAAQQSLVGAWRGVARSNAVRAGSNTTVGFALNCSQRWQIVSQSGSRFEGEMSSQGTSPESDWRCTETRAFAGALTADDQVTIDFSPGFTPGGCTNVVGGEHATGSMSEMSISVTLHYRAKCEMAPGGNAPRWDLEIATTVTLTPW